MLIFDDCSSDGTFQFLEDYIKNNGLDTWKITQNKKNKGWELNFWDGIREASGDIVFTCDQDDIGWRIKFR